jgi:hypothetical protein
VGGASGQRLVARVEINPSSFAVHWPLNTDDFRHGPKKFSTAERVYVHKRH